MFTHVWAVGTERHLLKVAVLLKDFRDGEHLYLLAFVEIVHEPGLNPLVEFHGGTQHPEHDGIDQGKTHVNPFEQWGMDLQHRPKLGREEMTQHTVGNKKHDDESQNEDRENHRFVESVLIHQLARGFGQCMLETHRPKERRH